LNDARDLARDRMLTNFEEVQTDARAINIQQLEVKPPVRAAHL
jgi:hypothetical protein